MKMRDRFALQTFNYKGGKFRDEVTDGAITQQNWQARVGQMATRVLQHFFEGGESAYRDYCHESSVSQLIDQAIKPHD
jgi:hypothetical protein